jgi:hypothetical protein
MLCQTCELLSGALHAVRTSGCVSDAAAGRGFESGALNSQAKRGLQPVDRPCQQCTQPSGMFMILAQRPYLRRKGKVNLHSPDRTPRPFIIQAGKARGPSHVTVAFTCNVHSKKAASMHKRQDPTLRLPYQAATTHTMFKTTAQAMQQCNTRHGCNGADSTKHATRMLHATERRWPA